MSFYLQSHKNASYLWSEFLPLYTPCSLVSMMVHVVDQVAGTYKLLSASTS